VAARAVPPLTADDPSDAPGPRWTTEPPETAALVDVSLAAGAGRRDVLGGGWCDAESTAT